MSASVFVKKSSTFLILEFNYKFCDKMKRFFFSKILALKMKYMLFLTNFEGRLIHKYILYLFYLISESLCLAIIHQPCQTP